jgi:hypothetical protein
LKVIPILFVFLVIHLHFACGTLDYVRAFTRNLMHSQPLERRYNILTKSTG